MTMGAGFSIYTKKIPAASPHRNGKNSNIAKNFISNSIVRMFDWLKLMEIKGFSTLLSIVLGFGIAAMFRPLCKGSECVILRGPPVGDIRGSVYQYGKKCVEFDAKPVPCPSGKSTIPVVETMTFAEMS
jgi:hypothetical protein